MLHHRCLTGFWICLNLWFWICLGYIGFWICLNIFWTFLNMPEYAKICINKPKSAWMAFVLFLHCNPLSTWLSGYLFQCLCETRSYSLKEYEAVFLKKQTLIFLLVDESIWFVFCFRLNIFTNFWFHYRINIL